MKLRSRVTLILSIAFAVLIGLLFLVLSTTFIDSFAVIEKREVEGIRSFVIPIAWDIYQVHMIVCLE